MTTLAAQLDAYIARMESIQQSPVHLRGLRFTVRRTLRWLEGNRGITQPNQLTAVDLDGWFRHVTTRRTRKGVPLKLTSVSKQFQCDRAFLIWMEKNGVLPEGLHEALPSVKIPDLLPTSILDHTKMVRVLDRVGSQTAEDHQLRAMLEILYSSGVRISELLSLNIDAVDLDHGLMRVTGKGAKERVVPIGKTARARLESYLRGVRPLLQRQPGQTALWLNRWGARLPYHTFRRQLAAHVEDVGLKTHVTAHTFRRSCATELIRGNANLWIVKDLLGHETVESLRPYIRMTIVDLKKTHKKCHPRERDRDAH